LHKALEDEVITAEEMKLLDTLKIEGEAYDQFLTKVKNQGISQEEINILSELKFDLLKKTYASVNEGDSISEDVEKLLFILVKLLNETI
jgi:hypothetical protein